MLFLLSDPDHLLARVISAKFRKIGWDSEIALTYDEGIALYKQKDFNIVITDMILKDHRSRTGLTFVEEINAIDKKIKALIIMFTDLKGDDDKNRAKEQGVKHYFVKSEVSINSFITEIKNIIKKEGLVD